MNSNYPLFDQVFSGAPATTGPPLTGKDLRDIGIEDALVHAELIKGEYVQRCLDIIKDFPSGWLITSEDVRAKAGDPPIEVNHSVMAGILRKAASLSLIYITSETRPARRVTVHAKRLSCWRRI